MSETIPNNEIINDSYAPAYLFIYEHFNIAWDYDHYGCFFDPVTGEVYDYKYPDKWCFFKSSNENSKQIFWGYEKDGIISRMDLIKNLNYSTKRIINPIITDFNLEEVKDDLQQSGYESLGSSCDMGITSYCILIYNPANDIYNRIILETIGDDFLKNKSTFTTELLSYFK